MSEQRQLVQLFDRQAGRLVPAGIRFGRTIFAPNVIGTDPQTGQLSDSLVEQMERALHHMRDILADAGAGLENVGRVTAYVTTVADRHPVYGPWDSLFPDAQDRPAFKVLVAPLPGRVRVRLDMLALSGARRTRIDIDGVSARDPTVVVANWVLSSRVHGTDPKTSQLAEGLPAEVAQAFANIDALIGMGGGSTDDVTQLTLFAPDPNTAAVSEEQFVTAFPDASRRPSFTRLHSYIMPHLSMMLEVIAATQAGAPADRGAAPREVFYQPQRSLIPDAMCLDDLFYAPAITAEDAVTGAVPPGFEAQLRQAFPNMLTCLEHAGLSLSNVGHVTVYMPDLNCRPILNDVWAALFPDPNARPPHKYVPIAFDDPRIVAQLQVIAFRGAQPRVLEIPGMAHADPMSMGAQIGDLLFSSRIVGTDTATGTMPEAPQEQANAAFRNVRTLLEQGGTNPRNLSQVTAFVEDAVGREATLHAWSAMFPDPADRPSLHFLTVHLPGKVAVRLEIIAAC
jgi:enamine deaminase RidA (YjgF/YER057c/UK114 family)